MKISELVCYFFSECVCLCVQLCMKELLKPYVLRVKDLLQSSWLEARSLRENIDS